MASKILSSAILLGLFAYCGGFPLDADIFHTQLDADTIPDALSLLQGQMEAKKAQVRTVAPEDEEDSRYSSRVCSGPDSCNKRELPSSFKISLPPLQEEAGASETVQTEISTSTPLVSETTSTPTSLVGTVLQALACLLIMDIVRRGKAAKPVPQQTSNYVQSTTASPAASSAALFAAAITCDETTFEAQISGSNGRSKAAQVDSWGCSALHYAAKGGSAQIVKRLLELRAWTEALDVWDETPLHIAARAGHVEVCQALLAAGARVDALNAEDNTPLVVAGRAEKKAVCSVLIGCGAGVAGLDEEKVPSLVAELLHQQEHAAAVVA